MMRKLSLTLLKRSAATYTFEIKVDEKVFIATRVLCDGIIVKQDFKYNGQPVSKEVEEELKYVIHRVIYG